MFNWIKNKFKKKTKPEIEDDLKDKTVASMRYVVDEKGIVYLDFYWNSDLEPEANEAFSELFYKINSGELLAESMEFIRETLEEHDLAEEYEKFYNNSLELQRTNTLPILEALGLYNEKTDNEVVVKPTDIADRVFRGNQR